MAYYIPPSEKVGGHVPRVPHQIAPMITPMAWPLPGPSKRRWLSLTTRDPPKREYKKASVNETELNLFPIMLRSKREEIPWMFQRYDIADCCLKYWQLAQEKNILLFCRITWFLVNYAWNSGESVQCLITRINEHKFDQHSKVYKHLLANPTHRFNFKQPEILGSIVGQKELHLLESLLIQQYQPDLNVDGSSILLLLFNT